jgi:hypothetical protein
LLPCVEWMVRLTADSCKLYLLVALLIWSLQAVLQHVSPHWHMSGCAAEQGIDSLRDCGDGAGSRAGFRDTPSVSMADLWNGIIPDRQAFVTLHAVLAAECVTPACRSTAGEEGRPAALRAKAVARRSFDYRCCCAA